MTVDQRNRTDDGGDETASRVEEKLIAFAEQLGRLVGTVQAKAEGWLDRPALVKEITRVRDGASELLAHVTGADAAGTRQVAPRKPRGPVGAPGKKHRKPPPEQRMAGRPRAPRGKEIGQKTGKRGRRGGRS